MKIAMVMTIILFILSVLGGWWVADYNRTKHSEWQSYFALFPVYVDAYDASEIKNGKMRYLKWGMVDCRWHTWVDHYDGNETVHAYWRYRLSR